MEIDEIRQELNDLLESVVDHSGRYGAEKPIPSLEISFVLSKVNKMQGNLTILKYLLERKEKNLRLGSKEINQKRLDDVVEVEPKEVTQQKQEEIVVIEETIPPLEVNMPEISGSTKIEKKPNTKLTDNLTLNDRYLYANELFGKDMNVFNEFVKKIDSASGLSTAKEHLFSLDLDMDNEHVASFSELIDKRFS